MLLYFKTKNNLSFDDEVEFSMIAGSYKDSATGKETHPENLIPLPKYNINLLKTSVIYGANASGKSNLLDCMREGVLFIVNSYSKSNNNSLWPYYLKYNRINQKNGERPISYTYGFVLDDTMFEYSFAVDAERVTFETLLEYRTQKPITHYKREYNKNTKSYDWEKFSVYFTGEKQTVKNITNERSLFLSVGSISELPICKKVCTWFNYKMKWGIDKYFPGWIDEEFVLKQIMADNGYKKAVLQILKSADFSIMDIVVTKNENSGKLDVKTYHSALNLDGEPTVVEMDYYNSESTGTRRFMSWIGVWIQENNSGSTILLDEFGVSMHTLLSNFLLKEFAKFINAQFIFTTHDTNLMTKELFRPDQIWIMDKDALGNSKLQPLSRFKLNKVKDIEQGYLAGLYGGVPYLKD